MAKTLVPAYVQAALAADRTQQVNTLGALVVYLFGEAKANREVTEFGETLHKASPHKSAKTWANYASAAGAIAGTQTVKLDAMWSAAKDPADVVAPLVSWLTHELKTRKYQLSMEDVSNWAKGRPSMAAKKAADDKAAKEAAAAQAKANADAEAQARTQAAAEAAAKKVTDDAEAAAAAELAAAAAAAPAPAPLPTGDENGTKATGYDAAIGNPSADTAPVFLLNVAQNPDGSLTVKLADTLTRDTLQSVIDALQGQCDAMPLPVGEVREPATA